MAVRRSYKNSTNTYTLSYTGMQGVDLSSPGGSGSRHRFSYLENMYKDYDGGGIEATESIPGFRKILSLEKKINALFVQKGMAGEDYLIIHAGSSLYRISVTDRDSLRTPSPIITLRDTKSHAFASGCELFVLDGGTIIKISADGSAKRVGEEGAMPYIPTTYYNGVAYEQRNLLTNDFYESMLISAYPELAAGSDGVKYKIISTAEYTCAACGIEAGVGGTLHIPAYVNIGEKRFKVTEIADYAFSENTAITGVIMADTVLRIGVGAFSGCTSLTLAVMRDGVSLIDNSAFSGCTSLSEVYFGAGLERIGISAFYACTSVRAFYYSADRDSFNRITFSSTPINSDLVICGVGYGRVSIEIPISTPTKSIKALTVGGEEYSFTAKTRNGLIYALIISSEDEYALDGLTATALGEIDADSDRHISASTSFTAYDEGEVNGADAILGCTVCEAFDGRIFLSGNERLPNTVFYSSRDASGKNNPLYFGAYNYFNDGTGGFGVESMLAAGDSLAVFKSGDSGDGSIYYHTPKETGIDILPKIYPVSYIHSGICAVGPSISFFDDPIFLSKTGVMALGKRAVNLERSVSVRSHNVNALLLAEDLKSACLARWCGYLFLLTGERAYLADSRATFTHKTGSVEYEWYYLNGIGTYRGDRQVFRYSPIARSGYSVHEAADEIVSTIVGSATHPDGNIIYFTIENGKKYEVYPDGEMRGGTLSPATALCCADGDLLFFGTECGDVCIFNNDKRGVAPPKDGEAQNTDEEYKRLFARRIHPYYYSFAGHAPRYALRTVADDGGFPNTTKCTEKHSLTVKLRSLGSGSFVCETGTEAGGYKEIAELPDFALSFFELDFSTLSFFNSDYTTLPLKEKEKGWIEKTVGFYSEKHRSPFGICAVTYRFRLKGKIKL